MQRSALHSPSALPLAATTSAQAAPRLRLEALDGIRGLAALYVVLYHAVYYTGHAAPIPEGLSAPMRGLASVLNYGMFAVPVFIVLSGFCLMLPLAQRHTDMLQGGLGTYLRRRAWRILPPYYAALLFALAMISLAPPLQSVHNTSWDSKIPVTPSALAAHLLLIHNFNEGWLYRIDGPMWSVAIEWQIYFIFPLVLLPVLRRTNMMLTVGVALVLGLVPHLFLPHANNFDYSHPWFLGLFAMGMAAAQLSFSDEATRAAIRDWRGWGWLAGAGGVLLLLGLGLDKVWMEQHNYLSEPLVGLLAAFWLMRYAAAARLGRPALRAQPLLESRLLVGLGAFSYSLYLIHNPIQALINLTALDIPMPGDARLALMLLGSTGASLACGYLFYLLVERRCMALKNRVAAPATTDH